MLTLVVTTIACVVATVPHLATVRQLKGLGGMWTCHVADAALGRCMTNRQIPADAPERTRRQLSLWQPSFAVAGLCPPARYDALSSAEPTVLSSVSSLSSLSSTDPVTVDGTFAIVVCLLVLAVASGQLIFLDSVGSSAGNEIPFRNRDALAAAAAATTTAVAAAVLAVLAARFY